MNKIIKIILWIILVVSISAVALFVYHDHESKVLDQQARTSLGLTFAQTPNGFIHYELKGPSEAELVVLVHGYTPASYVWEPTFQFLLQQGYQVLRFDLFGRGYSDRPDKEYGLDLLGEQINDLLVALQIDQPIHLLGLSMGGPIVTRFTNRYPNKVQSLILQDPMVDKIDPEKIKPLDIPYIGEYLFAVYVVPLYIENHKNDPSTPYFENWGDLYYKQIQYHGFRRAILSSLRFMTRYPYIEEYQNLATLELPKLLIWGRDDKTIPIVQAESLRELMPNMEFQVIEGAGHVPSMETPEAFNQVLLDFLKRNSLDSNSEE